jgi:hypothetical protein
VELARGRYKKSRCLSKAIKEKEDLLHLIQCPRNPISSTGIPSKVWRRMKENKCRMVELARMEKKRTSNQHSKRSS